MKFFNVASLLLLIKVSQCQAENADYGLNATAAPGANFDLLGWSASVPIENPIDGFASDIQEIELSSGYESKCFYTGDDGAMVFWASGNSVKTSPNAMVLRTELREMLRRGDTSISIESPANNWAFSSIPVEDQHLFRGIDGELTATLAVNQVTTTGANPNWNGQIIIGQINAADGEPCRLYYHKLPNNTNGALYIGHELSASMGGANIYYNLLGDMVVESPGDMVGEVKDASDPEEGIALDEVFIYSIKVVGHDLTVTISAEDGTMLAQQLVDMSSSGYDDPACFMYFKAGLCLQDNALEPDDYAQVSFYGLEHKHETSQYVRSYGLDPDDPPSKNFDLSAWKIVEPTPDPTDGWASEVEELELVGWQSKHFYTGDDGAMVFWSNGEGSKTSANTNYIKSELREMLRAGDYDITCCEPANNWILSSVPESEYSQYRGVDGELRATVAVNHLPTTGTDLRKSGRIILAQMHARFNEPCKIFYQKLPNNTKGALYIGHEFAVEKGGEDIYYNLLGKFAPTNPEPYFEENQDMSDPEDGIALNEKFQFSILAQGDTVTVTILNADGVLLAQRVLDISESGYDDPTLYMYFQTGLNMQDNTFETNDYAQVSFYTLETSHDTSFYKRDYGLFNDVPPSSNFDLSKYKITEPSVDPIDGWAFEVEELELVGYECDYFFTGDDGAMVFWSNGYGRKTSENTLFIRSELREMLRAGDYAYHFSDPANNWILSSIPRSNWSQFRGIDGKMTATLSVDHVPTTGTNPHWSGRIVIGQVHEKNGQTQICRLYYQKLPNNTKGALYFSHDISPEKGTKFTYYNLLGNMAAEHPKDFLGEVQDTSDPVDGIPLGVKFRYIIIAEGYDLTVTIQTENFEELASITVDMTDSGYDDPTRYNFFKAGLYLQDNSFALEDYAQVSFYELETEHDTQYYDDSRTTAPVSFPIEDSAYSLIGFWSHLCTIGVLLFSWFNVVL